MEEFDPAIEKKRFNEDFVQDYPIETTMNLDLINWQDFFEVVGLGIIIGCFPVIMAFLTGLIISKFLNLMKG